MITELLSQFDVPSAPTTQSSSSIQQYVGLLVYERFQQIHKKTHPHLHQVGVVRSREGRMQQIKAATLLEGFHVFC